MNFDEVVVKESPGICRCCLSEGCYKDLGSEYTWMNETEVYADMLLDCFDIGISQHNEGPNGPKRLICEVCITRLRDACNFKKQVVDSEKRFIDMLARGEFKNKVVVYGNPARMKQESQEGEQDDIIAAEVEYLDDMEFGPSDDEIIKIEKPLKFRQSTSKASTSEEPTPKGKRGRPKKEDDGDSKPKKRKLSKGAKFETGEDKYKKLELARKLQLKRRNIEYILQYSNATPFMWHKSKYRCFFCTEPMKDPDVLKRHTAQVHQNANLELVVYDRTKNTRNKDAAIKIDVVDMMCKLCSQNTGGLQELIHHIILAHDADYDVSVPNCLLPFKLDKDQPTCATCDEKFVFFEYLLRHANKNHLSHQYICDVCGVSFQGENHLKMHYRYYHREGGYTCEYCGISLNTLSKKLLHEKNIHAAKLLTCPHCPETFKSPYLKKLHMANIHEVEELKIPCPYCEKVFPQESIMSRHMRRVHLREKNVECEVCGDRFFGPYDVKLHMMKHNGDKNFVCPVCGKKFAKKSNLNTHSLLHKKLSVSCTVCKKAFTNQATLRVHIRNRHENTVKNITLERVSEYEDTELIGDVTNSVNVEDEAEIQMEVIQDEDCEEHLYIVGV